jgi:hypothetical protein
VKGGSVGNRRVGPPNPHEPVLTKKKSLLKTGNETREMQQEKESMTGSDKPAKELHHQQ